MNELTHPWSRLLGVVVAAGIVFVLDTTSVSVMHKRWLPLGLAGAAYLMTQSLMAVACASMVMAALNMNLSSTFWVPAWAYPIVAVVSFCICLVIVSRRFRQRIAETHEARWAHRRKQD